MSEETVILLAVCVGLSLVESILARELWYGYRCSRWPTIEAEILESRAAPLRGWDEPDDWSPQVTYRYRVAGADFMASRVRFGEVPTPGRKRALDVVAPLRRGSHVKVFVHPRRPHLAALRPGASALAVAMAVLVLCFLELAILLLVGREPRMKASRFELAADHGVDWWRAAQHMTRQAKGIG